MGSLLEGLLVRGSFTTGASRSWVLKIPYIRYLRQRHTFDQRLLDTLFALLHNCLRIMCAGGDEFAPMVAPPLHILNVALEKRWLARSTLEGLRGCGLKVIVNSQTGYCRTAV